jgi:alpha-D-xyloside xylohydrolase
VSQFPPPDAYERATPIFRPSHRAFHPISGIVDWERDGNALRLVLQTRNGPRIHGRVSFAAPEVARVQWALGSRPGSRTTEMLVCAAEELPVEVRESEDELVVSAGGTPLVLGKKPWRVSFGAYRTETNDGSFMQWIAEPSGIARADDRWVTYDTFALEPGEELYGLGERFHGPGLRGHRLSHWITEPQGTNTTDLVYKSVPLLISTRGYGLFYHHPEEITFDLGAGSTASASALVESSEIDVFLFTGTPKQILEQYTALTGRAPVPPEWSFGIWMSRCMYASRKELEEVIAEAKRNDCRIDVFNIDPLWLKSRNEWGVDACDFIPDEENFGSIRSLAEWLHEQDIRLCLWVNPHVMEQSPKYRADRLVEGGAVRDRVDPRRTFVDFTGGGRDWWTEEIRSLVADGVDCFKLDYGEVLPPHSRMADGRTGAQVHNVYPLLASIVAHEAGIPFAFTRAGTAGSQRFPMHWSGDSQSTWAGLAGSLRGGLAASWSGFAHWTTDIGGFYYVNLWDREGATAGLSMPDPELYIRWMQMGLLLSHSRFHGMLPREPWAYGETALDIHRAFVALRMALVPYLLDASREAAATGCPVMRPLAMEFPEDIGSRHVDTQYMLGRDLVVAPVLRAGGEVDLYVPPGRWRDHFTGEVVEGPAWRDSTVVPLERIPLLVRDGTDPFAR